MSGAEYMLLGKRPISANDLKVIKNYIIKIVLFFFVCSALVIAYAYLL